MLCGCCMLFFFFKQKTAYEMRISDWSSDVCSSDLLSEFLDFARVQVVRRDRIDLRRVAEGAAALAATHPDRAGQGELRLDMPGEPAWLEGDEDRKSVV